MYCQVSGRGAHELWASGIRVLGGEGLGQGLLESVALCSCTMRNIICVFINMCGMFILICVVHGFILICVLSGFILICGLRDSRHVSNA